MTSHDPGAVEALADWALTVQPGNRAAPARPTTEGANDVR